MSKPIVITHHGRPRLILQSLDGYVGLDFLSAADRPRSSELRTTAKLRGILGQIQEGFIAFDAEFLIADVNRVAELYLGFAREDLIGRDIRDLIPATVDSLVWGHIVRVLRTGEACEFNARSTVHPDASMAMRAFPYDDGVGMIFSNTTRDDQAQAEQQWWRAIQAAAAADPLAAIIRLNVRGGIEYADENFCTMTGFSEGELKTYLLTEIVHPQERLILARAINECLRQASLKPLIVRLLTREGAERDLKLTMGSVFEGLLPQGLVIRVYDMQTSHSGGAKTV